MSQFGSGEDITRGSVGTGAGGAGASSGFGGGGRSHSGGGGGGAHLDINTAVVAPTDRVRWGPILAGLFAALSTLALLSVLGLAVGSTAYDPGDNARNYGIGAGIWGAVSALIAFFIGGWLAARSAAVRGSNNGLLNGAMVWAVAIPLLLYLLAGGIGSIASTASRAADDMSVRAGRGGDSENVLDRARTAAAEIGDQATPAHQEQAADTTSRGAWGTLISLVLALIAASIGGYLGARRTDDDERVRDMPAAA